MHVRTFFSTSHSLSHRRINLIIRYYLEICSRRFTTTTTTTCTIFSSYFPSSRRLSKGKQQQLLQNMTQFEWNRRRRIVNYYTKAKFYYELGLSVQDNYIDLLHNVAMVELMQGRTHIATKELNKIISKDATALLPRWNLALIYYSNKSFKIKNT